MYHASGNSSRVRFLGLGVGLLILIFSSAMALGVGNVQAASLDVSPSGENSSVLGDTFSQEGSGDDLFTDAEGIFPQGSDDPTVMRIRYVNIRMDLLPDASQPLSAQGDSSNTLILNLFSDITVTAVLDHMEENIPGMISWIGFLEGIPGGQAILVVGSDGVVSGNVFMPDGFYQIRYVSPGIHAIFQIDQSKFPEDPGMEVPASDPALAAPVEPMVGAQDSGSIIDVMILYTDDARAAAGGTSAIQSAVNLAVTETNQAYANSGITQRIRLVFTGEVNYNETGDLGTDLNTITNGGIANVHAWRNTYAADLVSLIVENGGPYCGMGWMMTTVASWFEKYGYTVVDRSCATGYYSVAHEMGHNMGAHHDWYSLLKGSPSYVSKPYNFNHGYINTTARFRTIMSYNNQCWDSGFNCTRIPYFSNPTITYQGYPVGVAGEAYGSAADNRRVLNNTAYTVANFRQAVNPPPLPPLPIAPSGGTLSTSPTFSWNISGTAATEFHLMVSNSIGSSLVDQWYTKSEAGCTDDPVCEVTPAVVFSPGTYTWKVQGRANSVVGDWSSIVTLRVVSPLVVGRYDDRHADLVFSSGWVQSAASGPYASTLNYSSVIGSEVRFKFTGVQLGILYTQHPSWGTAEISIDGVVYDPINMNGALAWQQEWTSATLANTTHTVVIRHYSGTYIDIDAVNVYGPPVEAGTYDDRDGSIRYTGVWAQYNGAGPASNTITYTSAAGASASINFIGQGIKLFYTRAPGWGLARVEIDGEFVSYINQNGTALAWTNEWSSGPLPSTPGDVHTLVIRPVRGYVDVDKVEVSATPLLYPFPSQPLGTGTYDTANNARIDFTRGSWTQITTSGPYANTLNYSDTTGSEMRFQFTGVRLGILYTQHPSWGTAEISIYKYNEETYTWNFDSTTILDMNGAFAWQQEWTYDPPNPGTYAVIIRHYSGTYIDIDAVNVYGPPVEAGTYDDRDGAIRYTGVWAQYNGAGPASNTITYTSAAGASASINFIGQGIKLFYTRAPGWGLARVEIDGEFVSYINQNGTALAWTNEWSSGPLPSTPGDVHTLVIRQVRGYVDVDKVEVFDFDLPEQFPATPLVPGTWDTANNANIDFSRGSWTQITASGPYANTLNYSDTANSEMRFQFTGARLGILYTQHPSWGTANIYIDGVLVKSLNMNGTFAWQQEWTYNPPEHGTYTVIIRHDSGTYIDIDAVNVYGPLTEGRWDSANNVNINFQGSWTRASTAGPYANTLNYSTVIGSQVSFEFTGTRLGILYTRHPSWGTANIYIDGVLVKSLDMKGALAWQQEWTSATLDNTTHTVVIRHASGTYIDVDGIIVTP